MANDAIKFNNYILGKIIKSIHYDVLNNDVRLDEISVSEEEIEKLGAKKCDFEELLSEKLVYKTKNTFESKNAKHPSFVWG